MTRHLDRLREAVGEALEVIPWIASRPVVFSRASSMLSALACHALRHVCEVNCIAQANVLDKHPLG